MIQYFTDPADHGLFEEVAISDAVHENGRMQQEVAKL